MYVSVSCELYVGEKVYVGELGDWSVRGGEKLVEKDGGDGLCGAHLVRRDYHRCSVCFCAGC